LVDWHIQSNAGPNKMDQAKSLNVEHDDQNQYMRNHADTSLNESTLWKNFGIAAVAKERITIFPFFEQAPWNELINKLKMVT
jgi:hypothetical protein